MKMIFHIASAEEWEHSKDKAYYAPDKFSDEGFIHCSESRQLCGAANRFYSDRNHLFVLCIDETKVEPEVKYEDLYGANELFPHIYGMLNMNAVVKVLPWGKSQDGLFQFPEEIIF